MRSSALKRIRIFLALLVILSITSVFLDFRELIPIEYFSSILFLQFVPSVIRFLDIPVLASIGFLIVLLLTFITGRTYCSVICPLGIYQDIISRIGGRIRKKNRRFGYGRPFTILRYGILGITLAITVTGGIYLISILDPYSIYGRFSTYFFKPLFLMLNNQVAGVLSNHDIYTIYKVEIKTITALAYVIPSSFLFLVTAFSFRKGRLYCNTICPVGTLLGLVSKVSLLRIKISDTDCSRCGRCAIACKSSCIDFMSKSVDLSRCVVCYNCITICPDKAITYGLPEFSRGVKEADKGKREFIAGSMLMLLGISSATRAQNAPVPKKASTVEENRSLPVCLPGATSIEHFNARCTACSLCVSACPKDVIQPSVLEYGFKGIMQPRMDYHKGFCNFECTICTEICPTGALMPLVLEAKKLTQLGKAIFIKENCIVHTEKTDCGACSEHCPTKAVHMVPYGEANLVIPEVIEDICIGCGACEYACPTTPYKAIFVDGNMMHVAARKPETEKAVLTTDDFPF
jgi:ferredoxin